MQGNGRFDTVLDEEGSPFVWPILDRHAMIDARVNLKGQRCLGAWVEDGRIITSLGGITLSMSMNDWEVFKAEVERAKTRPAEPKLS